MVSSVGGSDAALIRYFAEKGITDGMKAKASYDQAAYDALRSKVIASRDPMQQKAQSYSSRTNWLILVNQSNYTCEVFQADRITGPWQEKSPVAVGAPSTPTACGNLYCRNQGAGFRRNGIPLLVCDTDFRQLSVPFDAVQYRFIACGTC